MSQKTGRVSIKLNGDALASKPGAQLQTGGIEREADITDAGEAYYIERMIPAEVTATIIHAKETDLPGLRAFVEGTLNFEADTGAVYTIPRAFTKTIGPLQNGEVEIKFGGNPAVQTNTAAQS